MKKKVTCKTCGKNMWTFLGGIIHLYVAHRIVDKKAMKRVAKTYLLAIPLWILLLCKFITLIVCFPFWWLYEQVR